MMQDKISAQLKNGKSVFITFLMVFFLVLLPDLNIQKGRAVYYTIDMMTEIYEYRPINIYRPSKNMTSRDQMIPLTDITLEEVSRYATIVMHYVNIEKGWNPGEYRIFFAAALANAPLAAFSIIHNDDKKKKKINPQIFDDRFSFEIYIKTDELFVFDDMDKFREIVNEYYRE